MLKLATLSKLLFAVAFAGLLSACGEMQKEYDQCLDDPSLCESTEGDALSAIAADAAAGNSCSATSADGNATCQVTCPAHERAICSGTKTTASCECVPGSVPPATPQPVGQD